MPLFSEVLSLDLVEDVRPAGGSDEHWPVVEKELDRAQLSRKLVLKFAEVVASLGVKRVLAERALELSDLQSGVAAGSPLLHALRITQRNSIRKCIAVRCSAFFLS